MDGELAVVGFHPLKLNPCVYIYGDETGVVVLTLYVDDILFIGASKSLLSKLKKKLMNRFGISDMGDVLRILRMNVTRDREKGVITISQKHYTKNVAKRYGMNGCNPAYAPGVGPELSLNQPKEKLLNEEKKRRYQAISGAVVYLAQVIRYDILDAVNQLARAMSKPQKLTWEWPSTCFTIWPGPQMSPSPVSRAAPGLLPFRMLTGATTPTTVGLRHHIS